MKAFKTLFAVSLITLCSVAQASPSQTECQITDTIDSPVFTFVKLPVILSNPLSAFGFAFSSYRNSLCPKPELMTRQQVEAMIEEALQAQQVQMMLQDHYKDISNNSQTGSD